MYCRRNYMAVRCLTLGCIQFSKAENVERRQEWDKAFVKTKFFKVWLFKIHASMENKDKFCSRVESVFN